MQNIEKSVNIFKALGDITRLKIIESLYDNGKSVTTIADELSMSQSAISHQLRILKTFDLVKNKRRGKEVYYSLSDKRIKIIVQQVCNHTSNSNYE